MHTSITNNLRHLGPCIIFLIDVPIRIQGHVIDYWETRHSNNQPLIHFGWELMWSEPKFTGLRSLESSQAVDFYIPISCRRNVSSLITIKLT